MCCIFTCCGWMIDLVQRLWTFTMSCCISSAVCCVMVTSSMSGIALGYNYSLAEYIDLKETNVSVFLKRGVFDDEIADDMDWRRAGRMPVQGHLRSDNLMTGAPEDDESTTLRSGRRLDDSVFEADDQNKYEGSLMKLTAKPPLEDNTPGRVTEDLEMRELHSNYPVDSVNRMKAIHSLLESRRAMAAGSTFSPAPTYTGFHNNDPRFPMYANPGARRMMPPEMADKVINRMYANPGARRMMPPEMADKVINSARAAVPEPGIVGSPINWLLPKHPGLLDKSKIEYFMFSPTYPSPIPLPPTAIRVRPTHSEIPEGALIFPSITPAVSEVLDSIAFAKPTTDTNQFNDKFLIENDIRSKQGEFKKVKIGSKTSEEEYEDEIKGLPVRKRRNVKMSTPDSIENAVHDHNNTKEFTFQPFIDVKTKINNISIWTNQIQKKVENNLTNINNQSYNSHSKYETSSVRSIVNETLKSGPEDKIVINNKPLVEKERGYSLLNRLMTIMEAKKASLTEVATQNAILEGGPVKKVDFKRTSFESKIVSSKYSTDTKPIRSLEAKQTTIGVAEILQSVSINLNEAGLLRNPSSSTLVKLLQSTFT